ncbi:hypothetical protein ABIA43_002350 [Bradyrhizobium sp. USDA 328]
MRNGQNKQRMRNRNNNNNNRRGQNPMTRVYESNGPDIKIRGTASHIAEKYLQLARDARSSGDPVAAENYYQHAEHYFRLIAAAQEQFRQSQQPRGDEPISSSDDGEDDGENFSAFGQEPGFVPQPPQQPFMRDRDGQRDHHPRDHQQRDGQQPYQRDNQQPARAPRTRSSCAAAISAAARQPAAARHRRCRQRRSPALLHHRRAAASECRREWRPGRV